MNGIQHGINTQKNWKRLTRPAIQRNVIKSARLLFGSRGSLQWALRRHPTRSESFSTPLNPIHSSFRPSNFLWCFELWMTLVCDWSNKAASLFQTKSMKFVMRNYWAWLWFVYIRIQWNAYDLILPKFAFEFGLQS